jgi:hypothetical protein
MQRSILRRSGFADDDVGFAVCGMGELGLGCGLADSGGAAYDDSVREVIYLEGAR